MAILEHVAKMKEGVDAWNKWRKANPEIIPDLTSAHISGSGFRGGDLRRANQSRAREDRRLGDFDADLRRANLSHALLSNAYLGSANLIRADLTGAILSDANLRCADLTGANLRWSVLGANLFGATLDGANLTHADLGLAHLGKAKLAKAKMHFASLSSTTFGDNDLSSVKGLESVVIAPIEVLYNYNFVITISLWKVCALSGTKPRIDPISASTASVLRKQVQHSLIHCMYRSRTASRMANSVG